MGASWFMGPRFALRFQMGSLYRLDRVVQFDYDGNAAFAVRW